VLGFTHIHVDKLKKLKRGWIMGTRDNKYNFLKYVPEIVYDDWEEQSGIVILNLKVTDPIRKFAGWLVKRKPQSEIKFDKMCSYAWLSIDGEKAILDIAKSMSEQYGDNLDNSVYRLVTYMKYISKRGWITFKKVKKS
jgi:hypothetical protein